MSTIGVNNNQNNYVGELNKAAEPPKNQAASVGDKSPQTGSPVKGDSLEVKTANSSGKINTKIDLFADETKPEVKVDEKKAESERRVTERKGTLAVGWGYGRERYAPSDMHFKGAGHDFTLTGVKANDRPSAFSFDTYFNPTKISIPQYMMDITYFPTNNTYIEFNPNHHMKWVAESDQMVKINGTITPEASPTMAGTYNGEYINMNQIFDHIEHTDGYNYVHMGAGVIQPVWESDNGKHALSVKGGVHAGAIVTKTDAIMFGKGANHPFKLDGFAYGAKTGVRLDFFKNFFAEGNIEYIRGHLNGFQTTGQKGDVGSQVIDGVNSYFTLGYQAPIEKFNPKNWFKKD